MPTGGKRALNEWRMAAIARIAVAGKVNVA